jgi:hypothetical protein
MLAAIATASAALAVLDNGANPPYGTALHAFDEGVPFFRGEADLVALLADDHGLVGDYHLRASVTVGAERESNFAHDSLLSN